MAGIVLLLASASAYLAAQGAAAGVSGPAVDRYKGTWDLGKWSYEQEFGLTYPFTNKCDRGVAVTFDTRDVPFLSVMPRVTAPAGKTTEIPIILKTPKWPDQPESTELRGTLIVSSSGYETEAGVCHSFQSTEMVAAHVLWWDRPPPPPKLKVAGPSDCTVWWNTGQRPPNAPRLSEEMCVDPIRSLAADFRERVLDALWRLDPERWKWLPSVAQVRTMTIDKLLAMKKRAAEVMGLK